jgi:hypothetical protein
MEDQKAKGEAPQSRLHLITVIRLASAHRRSQEWEATFPKSLCHIARYSGIMFLPRTDLTQAVYQKRFTIGKSLCQLSHFAKFRTLFVLSPFRAFVID